MLLWRRRDAEQQTGLRRNPRRSFRPRPCFRIGRREGAGVLTPDRATAADPQDCRRVRPPRAGAGRRLICPAARNLPDKALNTSQC
jgi:hypothetical protein